jgi:hypothetical protein
MERARATPPQYQPTGKRFVCRLTFNGLPRHNHLPDFVLTDPPLEHPLDGMDSKDQRVVNHAIKTPAGAAVPCHGKWSLAHWTFKIIQQAVSGSERMAERWEGMESATDAKGLSGG